MIVSRILLKASIIYRAIQPRSSKVACSQKFSACPANYEYKSQTIVTRPKPYYSFQSFRNLQPETPSISRKAYMYGILVLKIDIVYSTKPYSIKPSTIYTESPKGRPAGPWICPPSSPSCRCTLPRHLKSRSAYIHVHMHAYMPCIPASVLKACYVKVIR